MHNRTLFSSVKPEILPLETPFQQRVLYRAGFYAAYDLPRELSAEGKARALAYLDQVTLFIVGLEVGNVSKKGQEYCLVAKVMADTLEHTIGDEPSGTSDALRMHLIDALCEHPSVRKEAISDEMGRTVKVQPSFNSMSGAPVITMSSYRSAARKLIAEAIKRKYHPEEMLSSVPGLENHDVEEKPPIEVLPKGTPFQQRLFYRIAYYRAFELDSDSIFSAEGRKRAEMYLEKLEQRIVKFQIDKPLYEEIVNELTRVTLENEEEVKNILQTFTQDEDEAEKLHDGYYCSSNPESIKLVKQLVKQSILEREESIRLVRSFLGDAVESFGYGDLGTSKTLRQHIFDALCEHLGVDKSALTEKMSDSTRDLYLGGGQGVTEKTVMDAKSSGAWKLLNAAYKEMYDPNWRKQEEEDYLTYEFSTEEGGSPMRKLTR